MGCVRFITPKVGPNRGKRIRSTLYTDLHNQYGGTVADELYGNVFAERFKRAFGDWEVHKDKWKAKLDENGEPLAGLITAIPIKEGVFEVFESTPDLAKIGTQEQYSRYLNTIFPESKVKDIAYHGSGQKIERFEVRKEPLIHFGSKNAALQRGNVLNQVILNIKDLQTIKDGMWFLGDNKGGLLKELLDRNILTLEEVKIVNEAKNKAIEQSPYFHENYRMALPDGERAGNQKLQQILKDKNIGFEYINFSEDKGSKSYAVPSQEQIHILGSKKDITGFKNFIRAQLDILPGWGIINPDAVYTPEVSSKIDEEIGKEWLKRKLGDTVDLTVIDRLVDGHLMGKFHKGSVYLYENAMEGVLYHEAFHAVTQMFLTRMERRAIYDEFRRRSPDNKYLTIEQIEENLADEFSEYVRSNGTYIVPEAKKKQKSLFKRLLDSIIGLFYNNDLSIRDLYKNINSGKYAKGISLSRRAENFFNKYEMKTYAKKLEINRVDTQGQEVPLTAPETRMLMDSMTYYFMDTLFQEGDLMGLFAKKDKAIGEIYNGTETTPGIFGRMKHQLAQEFRDADAFISRISAQSGESREDAMNKLTSIYSAIGLTEPANMNNWYELAKEHRRQLSLYGIDLKTKKIKVKEEIEEKTKEETIIEDSTTLEDSKNFFLESIYYDTKNGTSQAVKMLIAGLPEITSPSEESTGIFQLNDLGLRIPVKYSKTYDLLAERLATTPARWEAFESKLLQLEEELKTSWLSHRLQVGEDPLQVPKNIQHLRIEFMQNFAKNKYQYIIGLIKKDAYDERTRSTIPGDIVFMDSNSNTLGNRIRADWKANLERNFAEIPEEDKWKALLGDIRNILRDYGHEPIVSRKKKLLEDAFKKLGVEFNPAAASRVFQSRTEGGGVIGEDGRAEDAFEVLRRITEYLEKDQNLYEPLSGVAGQINNLVDIEVKYNKERVSLQHLSPDRKTIYGITMHSYVSLMVGELNYIAALSSREERENALEEHLPHIANSQYTEHSKLKEEILEGNPLKIGVFDGYKYDMTNELGIATKELQEPDKYSQFLNGTLKGFYSFLRTADRGIENIITLENNKQLLTGEEEAIIQFKGYLIGEILTVKRLVQEDIGADISYYQDITTDRLQRLLEDLNNDPEASEEEKEQVRKALREKRGRNETGLRVFETIITNITARAEIKNMISGDYTAEDVEALIYDSNLIPRSLSSLVEKDIITYFNGRKKSELKRLRELGIYRPLSDGKVEMRGLSVDAVGEASLENIEAAVENFVWNSTAAYIEQTKLFFGDLAFFKSAEEAFKRFSMFNSTKKVSVTGRDIDDFLNREYPRTDGKIVDRGIMNTVIFEDINASIPREFRETLEKIFTESLLKDTNAAGKVVFTDDNKTLNGVGKIKLASLLSPYLNMEEADGQGYITLDEYRDLLVRSGDWTYIGSKSHEAIYQKAIKGKPLLPTEISYLQPLKTQYTGPLVSSSISGNFAQKGLYVPTGYKHSLIPLLPSMFAEDSQMTEVINAMTKNQWGIAQFRSGNKFGTVVDLNTGKTNEFYRPIIQDGKEKWVPNVEGLITQSIDYKYMGIQQDIPREVKEKATVGTQQRKIIQYNLFENGKIAPGAEDLESVVKEYDKVQGEIIDRAMNDFMEKMSIKIVNDRYSITDGTKFLEFITSEAEERNSSDNVLDSIASLNIFDDDGNSIGLEKLDIVVTQDRIENLLMSLINNGVIREKRTGGAKVQVANSGFEVSARSKEGGLYVANKGELNFYGEDKEGNVLGMEVAIAAPVALLKAYGSLDNLNAALERGELDHIKKLVGYRIPTQAMASIEYMIIKKFLPAEAGDIIVMPTEIVAKAGSDFDIDKLNIFMKEFKVPNKETVTLTEDKESMAWKKNRMIDLSIKILTHPYNKRQLLTPLTTSLMVSKNTDSTRELVNDIRNLKKKSTAEISKAQIVEGKHNMLMFSHFMSGKAGVGQDAVHITNHPLTQKAGTYIKTHEEGEKPPIRLFFEHNTIEIEGVKYPSLAGIRDVSGEEWISESLSNFMNAYVDIAKDPFIFELNARTEINNTIFYMLRLGVDPRWLARFLTQPAIENYLKERAVQTSQFNKRSGTVANIADSFEKVLKGLGARATYKYTAIFRRKRIEEAINNRIDPLYDDQTMSQILTHKKAIKKVESSYKIPTFKELGEIIETHAEGKSLNGRQKDLQIQILDNFLEYQRQSSYLQKLVRITSPDSRGAGKNIDELVHRLGEKAEMLLEDDFFGNINSIFEETFTGAFQRVMDVTAEAYSQLSMAQQGHVKVKLDSIKNALSDVQPNSMMRERVRKAVTTEFLRYVLMTANNNGRALSISLDAYNTKLFEKTNLKNAVYRLQVIRKGTDPVIGNKLKNNLVIKALIPILDRERAHIRTYSNRQDAVEENDFVAAFEEIQVVAPEFARDLAIIALIQSGKAVSPISFTKFIPNTMYQELTREALESIEDDSYRPNMQQFEDQFYRNNIVFVPYVRNGKYSYRATSSMAKVLYIKRWSSKKDRFILYRNAGRIEIEGKLDTFKFTENPEKQKLDDGIWLHNYRVGDNINEPKTTTEEAQKKNEEC